MAQDQPEEFDRPYPPERAEASDDFERRGFANVVVLLAAVALILIGYWVFNALAAGFNAASIRAASIAWTSSIRPSEHQDDGLARG
jgi:hypothetical protein